MSKQQSTPKSWLALAALITSLLSALILGIAGIALGWGHILLANLPFIFWPLYALLIISFLIIFLIKPDSSDNLSEQVQAKPVPFYSLLNIFSGIILTWLILSEPEWNGMKLLGMVFICVTLLVRGPELLRYLQTLLNKQQSSSK